MQREADAMGGRHVAAHSRRRRLVLPTVIGVLLGLLVAPAVAGAAPADKVEICHFNADNDPGAPDWKLLEVKNNKAVEKHEAHGDGFPGGPVPGDDGFIFGADCELIPLVEIDVMSQNLYIGADLDRILQGEPPAAVLETVLATDYPGRAAKIAETIGANQPDLVGIQEATLITVFDSQGNILLSLDYLEILVGQLAAQGHPYDVSSSLVNADVTLPIDPVSGVFARVVDRDAIIHNTETTTVANPAGQNFGTNFTFELGGVPVEFTRGFTGVDATVDGQTFRFVNTHLEVEGAPCITPNGLVICQNAQAGELIDALSDTVYPTILVGDFNAAPGETAYQTVVDGGYADTWNSETEDGYTCCQAELLDNEESELDRRIDHLFVRGSQIASAITTVLGDEPESRTDDGLWSSDHGAPFGQLSLVIVP
jgi:endonuclease/exonuclease/phosphatase family metal-dependent hydrolase